MTALGKYELLDKIGEGGFGVVYKARDPLLDRLVAVKILNADLARAPDFVERFRREAKLAASLRHPNIVTVIEVGEQEGRYYIVMEYLDGPSLAEQLRDNKPVLLRKAVEILEPLADALDYAHAKGMIHRDVKPGNVILSDSGRRPVLTDFGLVKSTFDVGSATTTGVMIGTPEYMAPEQITGGDPVPATDQYALGILAYQMVTGHVPFTGRTPYEIQTGHVTRQLPDPRQDNPSLPEGIVPILKRVLGKNPVARYSSCREFIKALSDLLNREGDRAITELYAQAEALMKARQYPEAVEKWDALLTSQPGFRDASIRKTEAQRLLELEKTYTDTRDLLTQARNKAQSLLNQAPDFHDPENILGQLTARIVASVPAPSPDLSRTDSTARGPWTTGELLVLAVSSLMAIWGMLNILVWAWRPPFPVQLPHAYWGDTPYILSWIVMYGSSLAILATGHWAVGWKGRKKLWFSLIAVQIILSLLYPYSLLSWRVEILSQYIGHYYISLNLFLLDVLLLGAIGMLINSGAKQKFGVVSLRWRAADIFFAAGGLAGYIFFMNIAGRYISYGLFGLPTFVLLQYAVTGISFLFISTTSLLPKSSMLIKRINIGLIALVYILIFAVWNFPNRVEGLFILPALI